ncbi:hypothetical protein ACWV0H_001716 [Escherichia coli]
MKRNDKILHYEGLH